MKIIYDAFKWKVGILSIFYLELKAYMQLKKATISYMVNGLGAYLSFLFQHDILAAIIGGKSHGISLVLTY